MNIERFFTKFFTTDIEPAEMLVIIGLVVWTFVSVVIFSLWLWMSLRGKKRAAKAEEAARARLKEVEEAEEAARARLKEVEEAEEFARLEAEEAEEAARLEAEEAEEAEDADLEDADLEEADLEEASLEEAEPAPVPMKFGERFSRRMQTLAGFLGPIPPPDMGSTHEMSVTELGEEARGTRPLLRVAGMRDSAIFHANVASRQYLRTVFFVGAVPLVPYLLQYSVMVLAALGMGGLMMFGPGFSDTQELQASRTLYAIVGVIFGVPMGLGIGYSARTTAMFGVAYATARVAQKVTERSTQRRTVAIYELPLLRMAFAHRPSERLFSGIEGKSGFFNGRMNLETDLDLSTITDPRMLYEPGAVRPCESSFTGVNTARRHALNAMAKEAGRLAVEKKERREHGDGLQGWIGENSALTFFIIATAASILLLMVGFEADPGKLGLG